MNRSENCQYFQTSGNFALVGCHTRIQKYFNKIRAILCVAVGSFLSTAGICDAEQSLVYPLHYSDDFAFYQDVFTKPLGRRLLDENFNSPIKFDRFHLTNYDDALFYKRHKLMLVNDSSQSGSVALIACILNGDEAIEFSRRLTQADVLEDEQMHPYGFTSLRISGKVSMYEDGPSQQPRVILAIDPCYVGKMSRSGKLDSYAKIRAPIRRWSQYFDAIIPNFDAKPPYF